MIDLSTQHEIKSVISDKLDEKLDPVRDQAKKNFTALNDEIMNCQRILDSSKNRTNAS